MSTTKHSTEMRQYDTKSRLKYVCVITCVDGNINVV